MKKVLAFFLTFALLLVPFSTLSMAESSYTDVTLTGTDGWNTSVNGDNWILYLTTNGYESDDWSYKYYGFTYEYNGVTRTTDLVSSVDGNRLYCTIPTSVVPATDGVSFTIKAGKYEPEAGTAVGLNILNDFTVVSVDGRLVGTQVIYANNVETFNPTANSFYFSLKDSLGNGIRTGVESWGNFLSPSYCDGTRIATEGWTNTYSGVFVDGTPLNCWDAHFKNTGVGEFYIDGLNATVGTKVTVKGHFVSSTQANWTTVGNFFLKELIFTYDGEKWNFSRNYEYANITLAGTDGWNTSVSGDNWVLYLTTNGYKSDDWSYKYQGFTYEYNGVTGTTTQVSSVDGNRLYCTIPTSAVPATDGISFTIKAGKYNPDAAGTVYGLNITDDFTVVSVDGRLVGTQVIYANNVETFNPTANSFYFSLKDSLGNGIRTGVESWGNFLSPSYCDGTRIATEGWTNTYSGVFVDGTPLNCWDAHFKNTGVGEFYIDGLNATVGTKVTVKGHFVSSTQAEWTTVGNFFLKKLTFTYDGSAWSVEKETIYIDYQGTPVFDEKNGTQGFYFTSEDTAPYDAQNWSFTYHPAEDEESGVFLNGEKTSVFLKKVDSGRWYVCLSDANVVPVNDDEITIAGTFIYGEHRITFDELVYVYQDSSTEPVSTYTGTPVLSEIDNYGNASGFYFTSEDGAPYDAGWSLTYRPDDNDTSGVFVNGTKTSIFLKKVDTNLWYVCVSDAHVTLNYGDVVTVKGNFISGDDAVTFNETSFEYNGKHFGEGQFTATDFTITGLAYSDISYNTNNNCWNMYFTLSNNIPGDVDATYFPYLTYEIDGTEYTTHWFKSSVAHNVNGEDIYNLYIAIPQLPATLDKEYLVTVKACASQGRQTGTNTARADGIRLTEDYQFVLGSHYSAYAPTVDYLMANGGDANGIYLSSSDDFPTTGWDYSLTKNSADSGVFVNGESTDVFLKKYDDNKYYVCLSDEGITAQEGTIVMLKGTFTIKNLNYVKFQAAKYIYTGGQWKVYSAHVAIDSTGISGDANGDKNINIIDLIHMKKYVAGTTDKINLADADLNGDGKIDANDIVLFVKVLLGSIRYETGANITGEPSYSDNMEMRLSAYVSPTVQEGFDDYKAAGFTTLISEGKAVYGTEGFADYMNLAAEKGLDVLVQSGYLQGMLTGTEDYDQAWLKHMCDELSQYSSFRGLFMGDEPRIGYLNSYTNVTNALKSINPKMDLFTSCLPIYTNEEYLWADNNLSLAEKYANYANAYGKLFGEFTYDFYPFKHSYKSFLGVKYNEKDYMRSDWFHNLTLVASNAKGTYNTGITVQSYAENLNDKDHYRTVTQADVSFQVYSALAYGMKSINYFTYGKHWDESVGTTSCMVYNGEKTPVYDAVKNINNEIKAFDHVLLDFNWQGTIGITGSNSNGIMNYVDSYTSKRISAAAANNDAIIGCLKDSKGYDGFMLVNATDPSANITETISVTFNNANHAKVYINGVERVVELNNGVYETTLTPGQGIFVIPYIA